jgi:hypothetical protein
MSDTRLTKVTSVLELESNWNTTAHFGYFLRDEDTRAIETQLFLPRDKALDMGSPKTITLTVEPGDKLNSPDPEPDGYHDDQTLSKVYAVLMHHHGYTPDEATHVVSDFQNAGLLFRERR